MNQDELTLLAGSISTVIFAASNVPMLLKVWRTRDVRSYSGIYLLLANIGNAIHWLYITGLPVGPIWLLHTYFTITTALMLALYLRYRRQQTRKRTIRGRNAAIYQTQEMYAV